MRYYSGFTLLESMLSMAIFSVVGIGIMAIISEQLLWVKTLENRVSASWVAENTLAEIKLKRIEQTESWIKGSDFVVNKLWYWQSREIINETIGIVTAEVRSQENSKVPIFILEGYRVINE
ncbi:type II secretion system minor pseudopilin GspI [Yersinia rochesterensis]|uniref:type II secretion system minor pseudopilin GspI n=1 Tax=Yersinia rochesterensis TaxID=1604335 RepID=UPI002852F5F2|nr:type II secretion system minor pseudopilin GspI [Yersinia rochesterensis]MDR5018408.1 type II secretion system minor pseudopilin GspI [Yersinia rochesterensis]